MSSLKEYEAYIEEKFLAEKKLKRLSKKLAEDCKTLWNDGDGNGGHVLNVIKEEFYKIVGRPKPIDSTQRKKIAHSKRKLVFEKNAYRCVNCGDYKNLEVDHKHPVSLGGTDCLDNLQTLCHDCNAKKSNNIEVKNNG